MTRKTMLTSMLAVAALSAPALASGDESGRIEIRNLHIVRESRRGFFRKEFEIPAGTIWRAAAACWAARAKAPNGDEAAATFSLGSSDDGESFSSSGSTVAMPWLFSSSPALFSSEVFTAAPGIQY